MHGDDVLLRDFLVDAGLLSRSQLADALQRAGEGPLALALSEMGVLGEDDLRRASAHALGVPFVTLARHELALDAMLLIPEPLARAHNVFAYKLADGAVEVAALDLADLGALADLKRTHRVLPRLTDARSMREALLHYQKHLKEKFGELLTTGAHLGEALINHALYSRAGGVHIDAGQMTTLVRYQIGHAMHEAFALPAQAGKQLVGQLKALAKLLPVERAQEGKFKIEKDGQITNVRVHAMPHKGGERLHLRLARGNAARGYMLESLGLHGEALAAVERVLAREQGLITITGALGGGKTTALQTIEDLLLSPHRTVLWADNAATARAALRHDPHALFLDDVRDPALAALATAAARRGVLVVAGVGADGLFDAPDVEVRVARVQRLANDQFRQMQKLSRAEVNAFAEQITPARLYDALKEEKVIEPGAAWKDIMFAHPTPSSGHPTGYFGHIGLQEVHARGLPAQAGARAGLNLIEDGLFKAAQGLTSVEEVQKLLI
ncbi:MAG: ATPase, T2SS/T4P/T4SS family [Patescibacteria group bacterium]